MFLILTVMTQKPPLGNDRNESMNEIQRLFSIQNNFRLIPSDPFLHHFLILFYSRKPLVISTIRELENIIHPILENSYKNIPRVIIHNNCILYFNNNSLLEFDFI